MHSTHFTMQLLITNIKRFFSICHQSLNTFHFLYQENAHVMLVNVILWKDVTEDDKGFAELFYLSTGCILIRILFIPLVLCMLEEKGDGWSPGRNVFQDDGCLVGLTLLSQSDRSRCYFRTETICMRFAWDPSVTFILFGTFDTISLRASARWDIKITCKNYSEQKMYEYENLCENMMIFNLICFFLFFFLIKWRRNKNVKARNWNLFVRKSS